MKLKTEMIGLKKELDAAKTELNTLKTAALPEDSSTQVNSVNEPLPPKRRQQIPITELVRYGESVLCPEGLVAVKDTHLPTTTTHNGYKIPRVVHMTSKSRCMPSEFVRHIEQWRLKGYSLYMHDEDAVDRLLAEDWSDEFEQLAEVRRCITAGATKADLWRYLILWEYGGIYSDIDNSRRRFNETTISADDDAFFPLEGLGIVAQYFFASSVGHPLMKHTLECGLEKLRQTKNVMINNPAINTGPGALKNGWMHFMKATGGTSDGYVLAGEYIGDGNRSVTVVGTKANSKEFVNRQMRGRLKNAAYKAMNMVHFSENYKAIKQHTEAVRKTAISCQKYLQISKGTNRVANYTFSTKELKYVEGDAIHLRRFIL